MKFYFFYLTNCINEAIRNNRFPDFLKLSDITSLYKKLNSSDKAIIDKWAFYNFYQKYLKKIVYGQLNEYLENFLIEFLYGFWKAHSAQLALQANSEMAG